MKQGMRGRRGKMLKENTKIRSFTNLPYGVEFISNLHVRSIIVNTRKSHLIVYTLCVLYECKSRFYTMVYL